LTQPRKIDLADDGRLSILWDDGHEALYLPHALRLACRCAHCEDEWTGQRRVSASQIPEDIRILERKPVGRYGLQFVWSDGHSTGIYTFQQLRQQCQCRTCVAGTE
jgi:DUF971 family protein